MDRSPARVAQGGEGVNAERRRAGAAAAGQSVETCRVAAMTQKLRPPGLSIRLKIFSTKVSIHKPAIRLTGGSKMINQTFRLN
jgi:hypothetical protein